LEIKDNSESRSARQDGLYSTWNDSGVLVVNTILSIGVKSRFRSTRERIIGRIGELVR